MFKSEPKSIIQFLATHFDLLRQLFDTQNKHEVITRSQLTETLEEFGSDIESQLDDHKFLVSQNDDFLINEPYYVLFEFILQQFKPLLPEEIEKFGQSIRSLFLNIKEGLKKDKNILLDRVDALSNEIKKFRNAVTNNTLSLLNESRELKANTRKIEYEEKLQKASYLIDNYIIPLNRILDINHSQSIFNELISVSKYANNRRFDYSDESIRLQFTKLYNLLQQVVSDISQQSSILSDELLPLIARIKTESEYLQGFHQYLTNGNCFKKIKPPPFFYKARDNLYNPYVYESTKEYFYQFKHEEDVFIEEETEHIQQWIFDKNEFMALLDADLPVDDFFTWCKTTLESKKEDYDYDNYFMITSLIFEDEYSICQSNNNTNVSIKTPAGELIAPVLKIIKNEDIS